MTHTEFFPPDRPIPATPKLPGRGPQPVARVARPTTAVRAAARSRWVAIIRPNDNSCVPGSLFPSVKFASIDYNEHTGTLKNSVVPNSA